MELPPPNFAAIISEVGLAHQAPEAYRAERIIVGDTGHEDPVREDRKDPKQKHYAKNFLSRMLVQPPGPLQRINYVENAACATLFEASSF
jgi:hypothetical protein